MLYTESGTDTEARPFARRLGVKIGVSVAAFALVALVVVQSGSHMVRAKATDVENKNYVIFHPPIDSCSKMMDPCTVCCRVAGTRCYKKNATSNGCLKVDSCGKGTSAGWDCTVPETAWPAKKGNSVDGAELYCFSVIVRDDGGPLKPSHDFELVREQLRTGASLFGCEEWSVFADVTEDLGSGVSTIQLPPVEHIGKRKTGAWVNTPTFFLVWQKIKDLQLYMGTGAKRGAIDWTVKVDPDAVFLPARLRTKLSSHEVTDGGIYIVNCKSVEYGFFGSLEIISTRAMQALVDNYASCKSELHWDVPEKEFGEDKFAQRCMELRGVDAVEDFTIVNDGVCKGIEVRAKEAKATGKLWSTIKLKPVVPNCGADRTSAAFHPFKKVDLFMKCLGETQV